MPSGRATRWSSCAAPGARTAARCRDVRGERPHVRVTHRPGWRCALHVTPRASQRELPFAGPITVRRRRRRHRLRRRSRPDPHRPGRTADWTSGASSDAPARRVSAGRIETRDVHCVFAGCNGAATWCDIHHVVHWAFGGPTSSRRGPALRTAPHRRARGPVQHRPRPRHGGVAHLPPRRHRDRVPRAESVTSAGDRRTTACRCRGGLRGESHLLRESGRRAPPRSDLGAVSATRTRKRRESTADLDVRTASARRTVSHPASGVLGVDPERLDRSVSRPAVQGDGLRLAGAGLRSLVQPAPSASSSSAASTTVATPRPRADGTTYMRLSSPTPSGDLRAGRRSRGRSRPRPSPRATRRQVGRRGVACRAPSRAVVARPELCLLAHRPAAGRRGRPRRSAPGERTRRSATEEYPSGVRERIGRRNYRGYRRGHRRPRGEPCWSIVNCPPRRPGTSSP